MAALAVFPCIARAAVVDATWIDGNSSWHNPAGGNIGTVPNNGANTCAIGRNCCGVHDCEHARMG